MAQNSRRTDAREAKRQRRFERQRREAEARRRAATRRRIRNVLAGSVILLLAGTAVFFLLRPDPEVEDVLRPPDRGRGHIANATYDTPTPTSGAHSASAPPCGSSSRAMPLDLAVHALEHGAVVVWHRPDIDDDLRSAALDILREWDSHWILSPNPGISEPFVATAWNRLKSFERADEGLREFIETYRRRGPERQDCPA